jgi:hypothetical protein
MAPILKLETPEAIYMNDMSRNCHFSIDCSCKGKNGEYSGSHYKNASEEATENKKLYRPLDSKTLNEHTFYFCEYLFLNMLAEEHKKEAGQSPLVVVCNDCEREFPFTQESYLDLKDRMMDEYNKMVDKANAEKK